MPTLNVSVSVTGLGGSIAKSTPRTADAGANRDISVPVGYAGTLTTRTDNNTGTVTLAGGHAITTGMNVDIYWDGGVQYNVTVGTVSTNSMPFDLGVGTNLPSTSTAVVVSPRTRINLDIDGDALCVLAIRQKYATETETADSHVDFQDSGSSVIAAVTLEANVPQVYDIEGGASNPFTGNPITKAYVSNGSTDNAAILQLLWLQDATP